MGVWMIIGSGALFLTSRRRHTRCALVTGVQTCALPISFEMRVLAWSSNLTEQRCAEADVEFAGSKERLLRAADFISIHLMLGDRSRGTIGGAEFDLMKPSTYLINTGRAEIVDQARSEEHTSELHSLMRISYAVFCLNK